MALSFSERPDSSSAIVEQGPVCDGYDVRCLSKEFGVVTLHFLEEPDTASIENQIAAVEDRMVADAAAEVVAKEEQAAAETPEAKAAVALETVATYLKSVPVGQADVVRDRFDSLAKAVAVDAVPVEDIIGG